MRLRTYLKVALHTTLNIILNGLTLGRYLWLEGRVRGGVFRNWARRFRYKPVRFAAPTTEEEIIALVKSSRSIRLFGSAHSFNSGIVSDETLMSLDDYSGRIQIDRAKKQMTVKGGTRMRDVVRLLLDEGWAFGALPSHDAQSIAGIISTDVHGTGRDWGFVSGSVVSLKLIDGNGEVHECQRTDELFKAAIGGIGAVGIITEVTVQAVERFNVHQNVHLSDIRAVEKNLDALIEGNEHFSIYLFPFTEVCQINTWNRTTRKKSFLSEVQEFISISVDALLAAWFGNLMAYTGLLPSVSSITHRLKRGSDLVMESNKAFNRTIYHLHQELEFTVPYKDTFDACRSFLRLYEDLYPEGLPYTLFEVRFTPDKHDLTLIGAGRDRRSAWIDLVCNDSEGFEKYYAAAEELIREMGARPHLGKYCKSLSRVDMERLHGQNFANFMSLVEKHDPARKFSNEFTRRLFGR